MLCKSKKMQTDRTMSGSWHEGRSLKISQTRCEVRYAQGRSQECQWFWCENIACYSQIPISKQVGKCQVAPKAQECVLETQQTVLITGVDGLSSSHWR